MKSPLFLVISIAAILTAGCAQKRSPDEEYSRHFGYTQSIPNLTPADVFKIRLASAQYILQPSIGHDSDDCAFISVLKSDPSPTVLSLLSQSFPKIYPYSDSEISDAGDPVHRVTGERGTIIRINRIDPKPNNRVEVECSEYSGNMGAVGYSLFLEIRNNVWIVVGREEHWIS